MLMISSRNLRVPSGEVVYLFLRHAYEPSQYTAGLLYRPTFIRPPERNLSTRTFHPVNGSSIWCKTPTLSIISNSLPSWSIFRMSPCIYSIFVIPNSQVFLIAYDKLVNLMSIARTLQFKNVALRLICVSGRLRPRGFILS